MEALYWYSITSKTVSTSTALHAKMVHTYQLQIMDVDISPPEFVTKHGAYEVTDHVWLNAPHSSCILNMG